MPLLCLLLTQTSLYPSLLRSGGEKKRCNIGTELLTNPSILLLDEPTSGLDSTAANSLVNTLRELATDRMTIITSIHQPSSHVRYVYNSGCGQCPIDGSLFSSGNRYVRCPDLTPFLCMVSTLQVFYSFDKLILMADGCMVYTGPPSRCLAYLARLGYAPPMDYNPADFVMDLVTSTEAGVGAGLVLSGSKAVDDAKKIAGGLVADSRATSDASVGAPSPTADLESGAAEGEGEGHSEGANPAEASATDALIDKSQQKSIRTILIEAWDNTPIEEEIARISASFASTEAQDSPEGSEEGDDVVNVKYLASYKTQFIILLERALLNSKAVLVTNLTVFQCAAVALIAGALWWQVPNKETRVFDKSSFIFFFMTYWFFSTLFHVCCQILSCTVCACITG